MLPTAVDDEWFDRERFLAAYQQCAPANAVPVEAFFKAIDNEFAEFAPVLKLAAPAKPLSAWFAAAPDLADTIG